MPWHRACVHTYTTNTHTHIRALVHSIYFSSSLFVLRELRHPFWWFFFVLLRLLVSLFDCAFILLLSFTLFFISLFVIPTFFALFFCCCRDFFKLAHNIWMLYALGGWVYVCVCVHFLYVYGAVALLARTLHYFCVSVLFCTLFFGWLVGVWHIKWTSTFIFSVYFSFCWRALMWFNETEAILRDLGVRCTIYILLLLFPREKNIFRVFDSFFCLLVAHTYRNPRPKWMNLFIYFLCVLPYPMVAVFIFLVFKKNNDFFLSENHKFCMFVCR